MREAGIRFTKVTRSFGATKALDEVSFEFPSSENTALLGPSGCGKSTALRLLAGLEAPDDGVISVGGKSLSDAGRILVPPHQRRLAMVFQDLALWPEMTALDNVLLGLSASDLSREELRARALQALALCRIEPLKARRPHELSGGQQQRVALARAIAVRPRFLLLDEPFSGLDLPLKLALLDEVRDLAQREGINVVLVTHDPFEALSLCSRAVVLETGTLLEAGDWAELMKAPRSETLRVFQRHAQMIPRV